jgi:hypothetical protein
MRRSYSALCFLVIGLWLFPVARADEIDQSFLGDTTLQAGINDAAFSVAQTFTAGITGDLTRIQLELFSQPQHGALGEISPYPINVEILSVLDGIPTSNVLSSIQLPPGNYLIGTSIYFPQEVQVVEGGQYAIAVNYVGAPPIGLGLGQGHWSGTAIGGYSEGTIFSSLDGNSWSSDGQGDLTFQTYVQPTSVPEPTISLLIVIGALAFLSVKSIGLRRH